jgi:8-oxo-dGTP diphosphatase
MTIPVYVAVIVRNSQGKFLCIHCFRKAQNQWRFPAGKVEPGETLIGAAARELKEEIGLEAVSLSFHSRHTNHVDGGLWTGFYFLCETYMGTPNIMEPDKHDAISWMTHDDLVNSGAANPLLEISIAADLTYYAMGGIVPPTSEVLFGNNNTGRNICPANRNVAAVVNAAPEYDPRRDMTRVSFGNPAVLAASAEYCPCTSKRYETTSDPRHIPACPSYTEARDGVNGRLAKQGQ